VPRVWRRRRDAAARPSARHLGERHVCGISKTSREAVRARLLRSDHVRPGRESITWTINREMIVIAGWGRAILLQLAHPAVAAGVHDHSYFRGSLVSSFRRLRSSVGAMLSLTFGDTEQMIAAAAGINSIHDRVRGRVRDGACEPYSAHDPELQRWVHATLLESIPLTYEFWCGPWPFTSAIATALRRPSWSPCLGCRPDGCRETRGSSRPTCARCWQAGGSSSPTPAGRSRERCCIRPGGTWRGRHSGQCSSSRSDRFRRRFAGHTASTGARATCGGSRDGRLCFEHPCGCFHRSHASGRWQGDRSGASF